jgi:hypothetical protein
VAKDIQLHRNLLPQWKFRISSTSKGQTTLVRCTLIAVLSGVGPEGRRLDPMIAGPEGGPSSDITVRGLSRLAGTEPHA